MINFPQLNTFRVTMMMTIFYSIDVSFMQGLIQAVFDISIPILGTQIGVTARIESYVRLKLSVCAVPGF